MKPTFFDRKAVVYKLTDANSRPTTKLNGRRRDPQDKRNDELCGRDGYMLIPSVACGFPQSIHANFVNPILWEAEADGKTLSIKD